MPQYRNKISGQIIEVLEGSILPSIYERVEEVKANKPVDYKMKSTDEPEEKPATPKKAAVKKARKGKKNEKK